MRDCRIERVCGNLTRFSSSAVNFGGLLHFFHCFYYARSSVYKTLILYGLQWKFSVTNYTQSSCLCIYIASSLCGYLWYNSTLLLCFNGFLVFLPVSNASVKFRQLVLQTSTILISQRKFLLRVGEYFHSYTHWRKVWFLFLLLTLVLFYPPSPSGEELIVSLTEVIAIPCYNWHSVRPQIILAPRPYQSRDSQSTEWIYSSPFKYPEYGPLNYFVLHPTLGSSCLRFSLFGIYSYEKHPELFAGYCQDFLHESLVTSFNNFCNSFYDLGTDLWFYDLGLGTIQFTFLHHFGPVHPTL